MQILKNELINFSKSHILKFYIIISCLMTLFFKYKQISISIDCIESSTYFNIQLLLVYIFLAILISESLSKECNHNVLSNMIIAIGHKNTFIQKYFSYFCIVLLLILTNLILSNVFITHFSNILVISMKYFVNIIPATIYIAFAMLLDIIMMNSGITLIVSLSSLIMHIIIKTEFMQYWFLRHSNIAITFITEPTSGFYILLISYIVNISLIASGAYIVFRNKEFV